MVYSKEKIYELKLSESDIMLIDHWFGWYTSETFGLEDQEEDHELVERLKSLIKRQTK